MYCGKVVKHVDVNTGEWINDANKTKYCSNNTAEILKYVFVEQKVKGHNSVSCYLLTLFSVADVKYMQQNFYFY